MMLVGRCVWIAQLLHRSIYGLLQAKRVGSLQALTHLAVGTSLYVFAPFQHDFDSQNAPDAPPLASLTLASSDSAVVTDTVLDQVIDVQPAEGRAKGIDRVRTSLDAAHITTIVRLEAFDAQQVRGPPQVYRWGKPRRQMSAEFC